MLSLGLEYRSNLASLPRLLKWYYRKFLADEWIAALRADTKRIERMYGIEKQADVVSRYAFENILSSGWMPESDKNAYLVTGDYMGVGADSVTRCI